MFYVTLARAKPGNDSAHPPDSPHDGWISIQHSAAESNALSIRYRAGFVEVASGEVDNTSLQIPVESHVEALYLEYVEPLLKVAKLATPCNGWQWLTTPLLQEAMRRDGVETPNYGLSPWLFVVAPHRMAANFFPNGNIRTHPDGKEEDTKKAVSFPSSVVRSYLHHEVLV